MYNGFMSYTDKMCNVSRIWFWVQDIPKSTVQEVFLYGATVLIGGGGATILVTSLSMVADLIGPAVVSLTNIRTSHVKIHKHNNIMTVCI